MAEGLSVGVDLVETRRIAELVARHGERFIGRVFTQGEVTDCGGGQWLAARSARRGGGEGAGHGHRRSGWQEIEVLGGESGCPTVQLHGRAADLVAERGLTLGRSAWRMTAGWRWRSSWRPEDVTPLGVRSARGSAGKSMGVFRCQLAERSRGGFDPRPTVRLKPSTTWPLAHGCRPVRSRVLRSVALTDFESTQSIRRRTAVGKFG